MPESDYQAGYDRADACNELADLADKCVSNEVRFSARTFVRSVNATETLDLPSEATHKTST